MKYLGKVGKGLRRRRKERMKYYRISRERYLPKEGKNNEIFQEKSGKVSGEGGKK